MKRFQIFKFYRRTEDINSDIEYIGGFNRDNSKWKITLDTAVEGILENKWQFYLKIENIEYDLVIINGKLMLDTRNISFLDLKMISL